MEIISTIIDGIAQQFAAWMQVMPNPAEIPAAEVQEKFKPLGSMKLANWEDLLEMIIRLGVHMLFVTLIVRFIYYPIAKRKDFLFTYLLFSISIFLMCFMLESVKLEMGFALGAYQ